LTLFFSFSLTIERNLRDYLFLRLSETEFSPPLFSLSEKLQGDKIMQLFFLRKHLN